MRVIFFLDSRVLNLNMISFYTYRTVFYPHTNIKDARYLYTPIIGHKSCNMLSILIILLLQKKFQIVVTNNVFRDKKVKTQQQQNKK